MKPLTLRQLRDALNELTEEQLDLTATVYSVDYEELYGVNETILLSELPPRERNKLEDRLDDDSPLLIV